MERLRWNLGPGMASDPLTQYILVLRGVRSEPYVVDASRLGGLMFRTSKTTPDELKQRGYDCLCSSDEVSSERPLRVEIRGKGVLVCLDRFRVVVVDEHCPHRNTPLQKAELFGGWIICPLHRFRFSLRDGGCSEPECDRLPIYASEVVQNDVWAKLSW